MPLAPKTQLGRYEIRSRLGAGGMGEVYLAHDSSLNRRIALKVLPAEVASDQDRMRRFKPFDQIRALRISCARSAYRSDVNSDTIPQPFNASTSCTPARVSCVRSGAA